MQRSITIRSGGQSGVDRAALDVAIELGLRHEGWCPRGGWAEDFPTPPGLLSAYPHLRETPSADARQRTAWNVRDSSASLILSPPTIGESSPGTEFTRLCAELLFPKPWQVADPGDLQRAADIAAWLQRLVEASGTRAFQLNVGGLRESEAPGVYACAKRFLSTVLAAWSR